MTSDTAGRARAAEPSHSIFFYIYRLNHMTMALLDGQLKGSGVTASQYSVLDLLTRHEPVSAAELARMIDITQQAMGTYLRTLELKGMVARAPHPESRKVVLIRRTEAGRATHAACSDLIRAAEARLFAGLPEARVAALKDELAALLEIARAQATDSR